MEAEHEGAIPEPRGKRIADSVVTDAEYLVAVRDTLYVRHARGAGEPWDAAAIDWANAAVRNLHSGRQVASDPLLHDAEIDLSAAAIDELLSLLPPLADARPRMEELITRLHTARSLTMAVPEVFMTATG